MYPLSETFLAHFTPVTLIFDPVTPRSIGFLCYPGWMCEPSLKVGQDALKLLIGNKKVTERWTDHVQSNMPSFLRGGWGGHKKPRHLLHFPWWWTAHSCYTRTDSAPWTVWVRLLITKGQLGVLVQSTLLNQFLNLGLENLLLLVLLSCCLRNRKFLSKHWTILTVKLCDTFPLRKGTLHIIWT